MENNSSLNTKYKFTENIITFSSEDTKFNYNGKFSIDPFDIKLNVDLGNQAISKFFNLDPILIELIKSEILFNENLNMNTSILASSNSKNEFFQNAKVYFRITCYFCNRSAFHIYTFSAEFFAQLLLFYR